MGRNNDDGFRGWLLPPAAELIKEKEANDDKRAMRTKTIRRVKRTLMTKSLRKMKKKTEKRKEGYRPWLSFHSGQRTPPACGTFRTEVESTDDF